MNERFWGVDIALDLFFGGLGVGTFILAVAVNFFYGDRLKRVSKIAACLTPACVALGFLFLILHLGRPERFYRIFLHFNFTSPISWGGWLQTIFFAISTIYALMWLGEAGKFRRLPSWLRGARPRQLTGFIGLPFALAVGIYHGFLLMVFKSRPLWNTGPVTIAAICGFITTGIALVVLVLSLLPKYRELLLEIKISRNILGGAILLQLFTIALWMSSLYFGPGDSRQAMLTLITEFALFFWGGAISLGLLLPLLIGIVALFVERRTKRFSYAVPLWTSPMVLIGGFILRYVVIIAAQ
jgi:protein NrfD